MNCAFCTGISIYNRSIQPNLLPVVCDGSLHPLQERRSQPFKMEYSRADSEDAAESLGSPEEDSSLGRLPSLFWSGKNNMMRAQLPKELNHGLLICLCGGPVGLCVAVERVE